MKMAALLMIRSEKIVAIAAEETFQYFLRRRVSWNVALRHLVLLATKRMPV